MPRPVPCLVATLFRPLRFALALVPLLALLPSAPAQPGKGKSAPPKGAPLEERPAGDKDFDEYRKLFQEPKTTAEFWNRMQFEIDVGRYDLASRYLKGLLAKPPSDDELMELQQKEGTNAFLKLRNIRVWSPNPQDNAEALKNVETLIQKVTLATRNKLADPARIKGYIQALSATPEEKAYAIRELYQSGALVVPHFIEALRSNPEPAERLALLQGLRKLGPATVPPLLAALDIKDEILKLEILDILRQSHPVQAREIMPHLWFYSASPSEPESVRRKASTILADFLDLPVDRLPAAKTALTREAERYYRHQVTFGNPAAVSIWRWDGKALVQGWPGAATVPASQAEEYWGLRFAGQALALEPAYRPAQVVFLSLALDKATDRAGPTVPLARSRPDIHDLLSRSSPELIVEVLERALDENRSSLILALVRNLGDRAEVIATQPASQGQSPLVRALYVPDRRVQFAAAETILKIPTATGSLPATRVVDILHRTLAAAPGTTSKPKVIVAYFQDEYREKLADLVTKAGFEAIKVNTGREVLRRLNAAADIDLVLADADLPDPGLAYFLGQIRGDRDSGLVPLILTVTPPPPPLDQPGRTRLYKAELPPSALEREEKLRRFVDRYPNVTVLPLAGVLDTASVKRILQARIAEPGAPTLTPEEQRDYAERAIRTLASLAQGSPAGFDIKPACKSILDALRAGKLSPEGLTAAAQAAAYLPVRQAQVELSTVIVNAARPAPVRLAAASALVRNIQRFGPQLTATEIEPLRVLASQPKLPADLGAQLALVMGSLRPGDRLTGEYLRNYTPPVVPVAPPPQK